NVTSCWGHGFARWPQPQARAATAVRRAVAAAAPGAHGGVLAQGFRCRGLGLALGLVVGSAARGGLSGRGLAAGAGEPSPLLLATSSACRWRPLSSSSSMYSR